MGLQKELGLRDAEEVTFIQQTAEAYRYRDAVRFQNGRKILFPEGSPQKRIDSSSKNFAAAMTYSRMPHLRTRATGIRIGECIHLALDCLRSLGLNQGGLQVPLGKLHAERLVPVDEHVRQIVTRNLTLRAVAPASHLAQPASFLLPRSRGPSALYQNLRSALHRVAGRAGCSHPITCQQK